MRIKEKNCKKTLYSWSSQGRGILHVLKVLKYDTQSVKKLLEGSGNLGERCKRLPTYYK